jgi:hypothetical protein
MKKIPLTQGKFALVSNCDYAFLMQWKWHYAKTHKGGYAKRTEGGHKSNLTHIFMHAVVGKRKGLLGKIDHNNQNKLDCQRKNLRLATGSQNKANGRKYACNRGKFKGVYWREDCGKWIAFIRVNKRLHYLGLWPKAKDAARAYNKAALQNFGKYACINKV